MDCYDFVNEYPGPADMLPDIPLVQYRHSGDTTHGGHSEFQPTLVSIWVGRKQSKFSYVIMQPDEPANKVEEDIVVSVSTVFGPSSKLIPTPADIVLRSSDNVFFYVHTSRLNETSENAFNALLVLRTSDILSLPEDAIVLNLVLHCIYNLSFSHYFPSLDNVLIAVNAMKKYGMPLNRYVARGTALFRQIVSQAPLQPIEVYMVAAENDLFDLAVEASSNLLAFPLFRIDDDMAARMGPHYLKRLFFLHMRRSQLLQRLLFQPPSEHAPTLDCGFVEQKRVARAWALASTSFTCEVCSGRLLVTIVRLELIMFCAIDLSPAVLQSVLGSLQHDISCGQCKEAVAERVRDIVQKWTITPVCLYLTTTDCD
ncbi:unnamed protein product [Somion occarium]|uniref:BTB domain-containing protein n=1 Tax=Somion occarium TaxID=3059160 RepID=A0ABP1DL73_9APHY